MSRATILTREILLAEIAAGRSTAEIAGRFGVQSPAVTRACHRHGLALPAPRPQRGRGEDPTRADDELLLAWLDMARRGAAVSEIGRVHGYANGSSVQAAIKAVELADLAESGEPPMAVARHYPKRRSR